MFTMVVTRSQARLQRSFWDYLPAPVNEVDQWEVFVDQWDDMPPANRAHVRRKLRTLSDPVYQEHMHKLGAKLLKPAAKPPEFGPMLQHEINEIKTFLEECSATWGKDAKAVVVLDLFEYMVERDIIPTRAHIFHPKLYDTVMRKYMEFAFRERDDIAAAFRDRLHDVLDQDCQYLVQYVKETKGQPVDSMRRWITDRKLHEHPAVASCLVRHRYNLRSRKKTT